jgi:hypothetical protein
MRLRYLKAGSGPTALIKVHTVWMDAACSRLKHSRALFLRGHDAGQTGRPTERIEALGLPIVRPISLAGK